MRHVTWKDFEFCRGQYINFTAVSIKTTTPHVPDKSPNGCLGDPAPFLFECISELADVLWLVRTSPDTSLGDVPQTFNWRQVWGLRWPWESHDSAKLQMILDNTCTMGSCIVVFRDNCIPLPTGVGHNRRLNDIVSVVEPSDIPLTDVEFCPLSHGDPSPNNDTSTSIAVVCDHGWRLVTLPS